MPSKRLTLLALAIRLRLSLLSLPLATIKLNGVDTTLNPILGTKKNDKLTASGSSADGITASLAEGKDLVELTAANEFDDEAESNITVKGEDGKDVIKAVDGLLTVTGAIYGNGDADVIEVARATGAVINGGQDDDTLSLGSAVDLNVAGSNATATITDSEVTGALGDDDINILAGATLDGATVKGDDGKDTIVIASGATLIDSVIAGNDGKDHISATGELTTSGSIIYGGNRKDTIEVADAGAMTVDGGKGKDFLRVGSGQTVIGGKGADTFSIEAVGGATITDYDAKDDEDCFCSDVIQVDGNKINYDTYLYKQTTEKFTSASSYAGNIKVKAFELKVTDTCTINADIAATKTATVNATAYLKYNITKTVNRSVWTGNTASKLFSELGNPKFPATYKGLDNGNSPRPTGDVKGIGFGYGSVTGVIADRDIFNNELGVGNTIYSRLVVIPNLTVYTSNKFEKGDFSFLDETANGTCKVTVTQKLKFDDVTRGTITNHPVVFGFSKTTFNASLYDLKFGTANFTKITTGTANLVITKGLVDKTYYPTPDQITNNAVDQDGVKATVTQTADGKYVFQRKNVATANAGAILNLSSQNFDLWTKRNSGIGNKEGDVKTLTSVPNTLLPGLNVIKGTVTADNGFYKYDDIGWTQAVRVGLLTEQVATNVVGSVLSGANTKAQNQLPADKNLWNVTTVPNGARAANSVLFDTQYFQGKTATVVDTRTIKGSLVAKIAMDAEGGGRATATLASWLGRAQIKGVEFEPTDCSFGNPLTPEFIANGVGGNQHNYWTPASVSTSNKGEFGAKWLWTSAGAKLGSDGVIVQPGFAETITTDNPIGDLAYSNGCTSFSCTTTPVNAVQAILGTAGTELGLQGRAALYNNNAFFSASKFTAAALAAEGMGDNAVDAQGAPFRVLFFDSKGSDNGLYVMSGTANYKNGDVTAINTNSTAPSGMGGKQTIVKVTGGKGHEISLSDINFV